MFYTSYEDGVNAGLKILELLQNIDPYLKDELSVSLPKTAFEPMIAKFEQGFVGHRKLTWSRGLIETVLRSNKYESRLITFWGLDEFFDDQENVGPICEIDPSLGFYQIGHFSGQGDGWILDTDYERIYHIPLGVTPKTREEVRRAAEVIINSPWQFYYHIHFMAYELDMVTLPTNESA